MAQRLGELTAVPEFNSQQPHDDTDPSIMRSGAQNTIYIINKFLKKESRLGKI